MYFCPGTRFWIFKEIDFGGVANKNIPETWREIDWDEKTKNYLENQTR